MLCFFVLVCFSIASFKTIHDDLRLEMWTWRLAESILKDVVEAELKDAGADDMMDADDDSPVSRSDCYFLHFTVFNFVTCKEYLKYVILCTTRPTSMLSYVLHIRHVCSGSYTCSYFCIL